MFRAVWAELKYFVFNLYVFFTERIMKQLVKNVQENV